MFMDQLRRLDYTRVSMLWKVDRSDPSCLSYNGSCFAIAPAFISCVVCSLEHSTMLSLESSRRFLFVDLKNLLVGKLSNMREYPSLTFCPAIDALAFDHVDTLVAASLELRFCGGFCCEFGFYLALCISPQTMTWLSPWDSPWHSMDHDKETEARHPTPSSIVTCRTCCLVVPRMDLTGYSTKRTVRLKIHIMQVCSFRFGNERRAQLQSWKSLNPMTLF